MMGTMALRQPENWLYEIWQKGYDSPCYVMVPNAKDLVKSHLMIAVREEVEVLKEKISELMDKINQLEVENTLLKANMSQETLQQLQMQTQLQIAGTGGGSTANMLTAPPTQSAIAANTASVGVAASAAAAVATTESAETAAAAATAAGVVTPDNVGVAGAATPAAASGSTSPSGVGGGGGVASVATNGPMS